MAGGGQPGGEEGGEGLLLVVALLFCLYFDLSLLLL